MPLTSDPDDLRKAFERAKNYQASWLLEYLNRQAPPKVMAQGEVDRRISEGERACEVIRLERMWRLPARGE